MVLGIALIGLTACKKKDIKKVEKTVTEGTWKITKFIDSGDDETTSYSSAVLTFTSDGKVVLAQGGTSYGGTWSVKKESKDDDHSSDDSDLEFNLSVPSPHQSLSDDWHIESYSDSKVTLYDLDKDEPNKSDYLTIEKI